VSREIDVEVIPPGAGLRADRPRWDRPGCGLLLLWLALAWGLELVDVLLPMLQLDRFGIRPRELSSLPGILFAPWLHVGFIHLIGNTLAFLGLGTVVLLADGRRFLSTTLILVVASGLGTWLIGRSSIHIGASGLIYGYFGYVMGRAIWEKKIGWALLGILVAVVYGGMIWGVLPSNGPVSWEGHLSGLLAGLWLGWTHVKDDQAGKEAP
jgi:membrane associated rhomboid family serine protease